MFEIPSEPRIKLNNLGSKSKIKYRQEMKRKIIKYSTEQLKIGRYVTKRELQKKFHINFYSYYKNIITLYKSLRIDVLENQHLRHDDEIKNMIKYKMIEFVKENVRIGKKPTVEDIKRNFKSGIEAYFPNGIFQLYNEAGIDITNMFTFLYKEKEKRFTKIAKLFLEKMGYEIKHVSIKENRRGADIISIKNEIIIPVELKARHRNSILLYPHDDAIKQIQRYMQELNSPMGVIITTTNKINFYGNVKIPKNVKIYTYDDLLTHFYDNKRILQEIDWIRDSVSESRKSFIGEKQRKIIEYVKEKSKNGCFPTYREIEKKFRIRFLVYFKNIYELYDKSNVKYPEARKHKFRKFTENKKDALRQKICKFIEKRRKENKRLNANEIEKIFHVDVRRYFSSRIDMYKMAGVHFSKSEYKKRFGIGKGPKIKV